jgi:hypothetical protein
MVATIHSSPSFSIRATWKSTGLESSTLWFCQWNERIDHRVFFQIRMKPEGAAGFAHIRTGTLLGEEVPGPVEPGNLNGKRERQPRLMPPVGRAK